MKKAYAMDMKCTLYSMEYEDKGVLVDKKLAREIWKEEKKKVDEAATELGVIYTSNVFPKMKVTWGTYPNHLGHEDFPGCFRCHDGLHVNEKGTHCI